MENLSIKGRSAYRFPPLGQARGVVIWVHGMAEHGQRYAEASSYLAERGFEALSYDQRGHGRTRPAHELGLFAAEGGWELVQEDLQAVVSFARQHHAGLPLFLLGHSMGSFVVQAYLERFSHEISGAGLLGSQYLAPLAARAYLLLIRVEARRLGWLAVSPLLERISLGSFNRCFVPNRTSHDWLSRDPQEVDRFLADPACGFPVRIRLWGDLMEALAHLYQHDSLARIRTDLPLLMLSGSRDPMARHGAVDKLLAAYRRSGHSNVRLKYYPDYRHELLHEIGRDEVLADITTWLEQRN